MKAGCAVRLLQRKGLVMKLLKTCFQKIKETFLNRAFIMFLLIGLFNTFNGTLFSYCYSAVIENANLAFVAGYITSLFISYLLNSFITFKERLSVLKFIRFAVSYIPNFLIQNAMVFLFYNTLHWHKLLTYAMAAVIGVPVTFIILKVFAFKKDASEKD